MNSQMWRLVPDKRVDFGRIDSSFAAREPPSFPAEAGGDLRPSQRGAVSVKRGGGAFEFTITPKTNPGLDKEELVCNRAGPGRGPAGLGRPERHSREKDLVSLGDVPPLGSKIARACEYANPDATCAQFKPTTAWQIGEPVVSGRSRAVAFPWRAQAAGSVFWRATPGGRACCAPVCVMGSSCARRDDGDLRWVVTETKCSTQPVLRAGLVGTRSIRRCPASTPKSGARKLPIKRRRRDVQYGLIISRKPACSICSSTRSRLVPNKHPLEMSAWRTGLLRSTMRYGFLMRAPNRTTGDLRWVVTETNSAAGARA